MHTASSCLSFPYSSRMFPYTTGFTPTLVLRETYSTFPLGDTEPQRILGMQMDWQILVLSPKSDAVPKDMEAISLQPGCGLPSIQERKNVLQLRLQQRRTREQLVDQGIMPPLKTPAAFHGQIRSLERARTENFLKHKISSRPERSELVRMHILQESQAEPSLQATQMKLKRARLADDLNEKIALRPGPMELVEKNILPVESSVKETISESETSVQKAADVYNFNEDSKDARSPDGQESQCSVPSPREARLPEISSATLIAGSSLQSSELLSQASAEDQTNTQHIPPAQPVSTSTAAAAPPIKSGLTLVKQAQPKPPGEKSRSKKSKDPKPRVKKLKYHLYVPPDQKQEPNEAPMDSTYARLLQQQQQFLHLQILSQQQQHYSYQAILPAPAPANFRPSPKVQSSCSNVAVRNNQAPPVVSLPSATPGPGTNGANNRKLGPLPANLDEMKVAELKIELKQRGLPVSGTKTDLIERLKPYQESHQVTSTQPSETNGVIPLLTNHKTESMSMTPPVSPVHSEVSTGSMEETSDSKTLAATSPSIIKTEDTSMDSTGPNRDQSLYEKERQIEELIRKLEQEQRLVEELKMQLEVEKRNQQGATQQQQSDLETRKRIKEEREVFSSCTSTLEEEESQSQTQTHQFYIAAQRAPASQNILSTQMEQHVLPTTIHRPQTGPVLQTSESASFQQHTNLPQAAPQMTSVCSGSGSSSGIPPGPNQEQHRCEVAQSRSPGRSPPNAFTAKPSSPCPPTLILPPSPFSNHHSPKNKDPPRYEEAVKQTRALQATMQIPTAVSQHMDDLFDVLIESG
ncbi:MKL/myocardin-like protein 2 isoform X1, partial [Clarias magur]